MKLTNVWICDIAISTQKTKTSNHHQARRVWQETNIKYCLWGDIGITHKQNKYIMNTAGITTANSVTIIWRKTIPDAYDGLLSLLKFATSENILMVVDFPFPVKTLTTFHTPPKWSVINGRDKPTNWIHIVMGKNIMQNQSINGCQLDIFLIDVYWFIRIAQRRSYELAPKFKILICLSSSFPSISTSQGLFICWFSTLLWNNSSKCPSKSDSIVPTKKRKKLNPKLTSNRNAPWGSFHMNPNQE